VRHLGLLEELDHLARLARSVERVGQVQRGHSLSVVTADAANAFSDYRDRNLATCDDMRGAVCSANLKLTQIAASGAPSAGCLQSLCSQAPSTSLA
jgi:hypothetical protein